MHTVTESIHKSAKGLTVQTKDICSFNMKLIILVTLVVAVSVGNSAYTSKFDNVNVDEILESHRLLKGYVDCLMDKGRCTPDAKELKETLPDALEHECSSCTEIQKTSSEKVIRHLINKRPELWEALSVKYDPKKIYQQKYKDKLDAVKH